MIQVIGLKRFLLLLVLLIVNTSLVAGLYLYTIPEQANSEMNLRTLRGQVNTVQADIERMQIEFEQLDKQQESFDELKANGFFSNQVRSDAKTLFSIIQDESNVISAVVSVKSGAVVDNDEALKANHKLLVSPVSIEIEAFDDAAVYEYLHLVQDRFPGHMSIDAIQMERVEDVSAPILRAIASGSNVALIKARISMSWRTLIPESQILIEKGDL